MPTIRRFEEIRAWQSARNLVTRVYAITQQKQFSVDFALRDQIRRASISVMSNIAEGFDSGYSAEFTRFLRLAFRSCSEVQSQLYTALDLAYIDMTTFESVYADADLAKKQINSFISYLRKRSARSDHKLGEERAGYFSESPDEFELDVSDDLFAFAAETVTS